MARDENTAEGDLVQEQTCWACLTNMCIMLKASIQVESSCRSSEGAICPRTHAKKQQKGPGL